MEIVIHTDQVISNYRKIQQHTEAEIAAVVKSNCYGLGVAEIVPELHKQGCNKFFVAHLSEALELRTILPSCEIYLLHGFDAEKEEEELLYDYNIIPVISTMEQLGVWCVYAEELDEELKYIAHIDTGMTRLGIPEEELEEVKYFDCSLKCLYVMSHLSCADDPDSEHNQKQLDKFNELRAKYFPGVPASLANSAGVFLEDGVGDRMTRSDVLLQVDFGTRSVTLNSYSTEVANLGTDSWQQKSSLNFVHHDLGFLSGQNWVYQQKNESNFDPDGEFADLSGTFYANFYGENAEEIAGTWQFNAADKFYQAAFGAKR